ncbi:Fumarylacetoacetate (FAA) hydrolase family [Zea mays]|uniref:Fumarylacetoacetate (FAA) hydrolase family n=1 Tax=Zea mays TaxID=4577 RepID=A0A1D6QEM5_MAIZE|nr:Fumarylacetoacetate (FAA) hydrolase family [Zea mays]
MREEPILFLKPTSSFLHAGVATVAVEIPEPLKSLHHKVELVVVISWRGRDVPEASAMDFVRDGPIHLYQQVLNAGDDMIGVECLEEDSDGKASLAAIPVLFGSTKGAELITLKKLMGPGVSGRAIG